MNRKRSRKRPENPSTAARRGNAAAKRPLLEGNSKITNQRITLPPGFLAKGFRSQTVKKSEEEENIYSDERCILDEDLQGLIKRYYKPVRRSERIFNKNSLENTTDSDSVPRYFVKLLNSEKPQLDQREDNSDPPCDTNNESNSIFKEINDKFSSNSNLGNDRTSVDCNSNFCKDLCKRITGTFKKNALAEAGNKISLEISKINYILTRNPRMEMETSPIPAKLSPEKFNENKDLKLVPKTEWVFKTPPRQRIVIPKAEGCQIQPAVICTSKKALNIYELKPKVNVDLNQFETDKVPIDTRFLTRVDSFQARESGSNNIGEQNISYMDCENIEGNVNVDMTYLNPFFKSMTCRPEKAIKRTSKIEGMQRLNIFSTSASDTECVTEFHKDFSFIDINKEWKTSPLRENSSTLEFKKQLFRDDTSDDGKFFKFPKEPKLFDFSKK